MGWSRVCGLVQGLWSGTGSVGWLQVCGLALGLWASPGSVVWPRVCGLTPGLSMGWSRVCGPVPGLCGLAPGLCGLVPGLWSNDTGGLWSVVEGRGGRWWRGLQDPVSTRQVRRVCPYYDQPTSLPHHIGHPDLVFWTLIIFSLQIKNFLFDQTHCMYMCVHKWNESIRSITHGSRGSVPTYEKP